MALEGQRRD